MTKGHEVMPKNFYMNDLDVLGARNTKIWMPAFFSPLTPVIAWAIVGAIREQGGKKSKPPNLS